MRWIFPILLLAPLALAQPASADSPQAASSKQIARTLEGVIREVLPTEYEKRDDWGRTKAVTTGLRVRGIKISRRKKERRHGVWKHYRLTLSNQDKPLDVRVESLRSLETGRIACRVIVDGRLNGWAQVRHFNRGVHLGTISADGESRVRLTINCEVGLRVTFSPVGLAIEPVVKSSHLDLEDFRLRKLGKLHGDPAAELGKGMRKVAEELLNDAKLTAKLNRAIEKKRHKLALSVGS